MGNRTSARAEIDRCFMDQRMQKDAVEVTLEALSEILPPGTLPKRRVRKLLTGMVQVLTTARCGCRFNAYPANSDGDWEMSYCARHGGNFS